MKLFYLLILLTFPFIGNTQSVTIYNRSAWTVTPSSQELISDAPNGPATKMLDGDNNTYWLSEITNNYAQYPHTLIFDMQVAQPVNQLYYVPRNNGATSAYSGSVSFGDDGINFGTEIPVIFSKTFVQNFIVLPATQNHRYFRITIAQNQSDHDAGANNLIITTMAEVGAIYNTTLEGSLTSFAAQSQVAGVQLNWSTAQEVNATSFNITRSTDAVNFTTIGSVPSTGNSSTPASYSFTDNSPLTGINFYRLEMVNTSGPAQSSIIKNSEFPLVTYSSDQPKNLNVFYFIPAGKAPWPDFKNRLDNLLINLQAYYKSEMQRNGINKTFGMVTDAAHKKVNIIVVHGKYPIGSYLSTTGGTVAIQAEIDAYMAANPSPYYSGHSLMIAPVVGYDVATATIDEGVPVGGTGKNCHVVDNPELKWSLLGVDESPQSYNATYQIGAWAHEFGHAVGLPHNYLKVSEVPTLGTSLMSFGNGTFGRSTTSLSHTDAAILNHNQLFNDGSISYYGPNHASISSVHACYSASKNAIIVAGRVSTTGAQVTDVEIYNDPSNGSAPGVGDNNDYDAVAWTTPIIGTDSFYVEMPITELQVRDSSLYQMRFRLVQRDGNLSDFRYQYDFAINIPELNDPAFTPIGATITASAGANGSISPAGATVINCAGNQTYTITPNSGAHVLDVLVDNVSVGAVTTYAFTGVNKNHTISATFSAVVVNYTINASAGLNGSISPSGAVIVAGGTSKSFTITPVAGFHVLDVLVDNGSVGAVTSYNFPAVTANHTIVASFATNTGCTVPGLSAVVTNVSCKGSSTGAINLSTTGGSSPFTYAWTGPNNFTATSQDLTGRAAGTYKVVVKATGGCTSTATYVITEPAAALSVSAVATAISCAGGATSVTVSATGGTSPYTGTGIKTGQLAGSHTYTVTDAKGCTSSKTITIAAGPTKPAAPLIVGQWFNLCGGGTFVFFVYPPSGTIGYTWVVPAGFSIVSGQGTALVKIKVPASFTTQAVIKVSATNSCGTGPQGSLTVYAVAGNVSSLIAGPGSVSAGQKNVQYSLPSCSAFTYTWVAPTGATITSGQGTSSILVKFGSTSGYVKVTVKNSCGSSPQSSKYVTVGGSALSGDFSTDKIISNEARLSLYPNPAVNNATLVFNSPKNDAKFTIIVTDIAGKLLFKKAGNTVLGNNTHNLDMAKYSSGVYTVTLITENNAQTLKLIKGK